MVITPRRGFSQPDRPKSQSPVQPQNEPEDATTEVEDTVTVTIPSNWFSPGFSDDKPTENVEISDDDNEVVVDPPPPPATFVRVVHNQVGLYPRDSVLPASTFEYLDNLLALGAVVYDYNAIEQNITGNPEHMAMVTGVARAASQVLPTAPWISAAAHNLLGATYVPLSHINRPWTPPTVPLHQSIVPEPAPSGMEPVTTQHSVVSN